MPEIMEVLRGNLVSLFGGVGVVWLGIVVVTGSMLILWPAVACIGSAVLLKYRPGRFTWAWSLASAALGFFLSAYQVYAWAPFLGGAFSALAGASLGGFLVFTLVHVLLFFSGAQRPKAPKAAVS